MKKEFNEFGEIPRKYRKIICRLEKELRRPPVSEGFYTAAEMLLTIPERKSLLLRSQLYYLLLRHHKEIDLRRLSL